MNRKARYILRILLGGYLTFLGIQLIMQIAATEPTNKIFLDLTGGVLFLVGALYIVFTGKEFYTFWCAEHPDRKRRKKKVEKKPKKEKKKNIILATIRSRASLHTSQGGSDDTEPMPDMSSVLVNKEIPVSEKKTADEKEKKTAAVKEAKTEEIPEVLQEKETKSVQQKNEEKSEKQDKEVNSEKQEKEKRSEQQMNITAAEKDQGKQIPESVSKESADKAKDQEDGKEVKHDKRSDMDGVIVIDDEEKDTSENIQNDGDDEIEYDYEEI